MIQVPCPWCGERNSQEFRFVGDVKSRPDPAIVGPHEWRAYLYTQPNCADWATESWYHRAGCRRFFVVERHRVTNEIRASRPPAKQQPQAAAP